MLTILGLVLYRVANGGWRDAEGYYVAPLATLILDFGLLLLWLHT